jgi:hypothetical protein
MESMADKEVKLKKIDLDLEKPEKKDQKIIEPMKKHSGVRKIFTVIGGIFLVLIVAIGITGAVLWFKVGGPAKKLMAEAQVAQTTGKALAAAVKSQNLEESKNKLKELRGNLETIKSTYQELNFLKTVPFVGPYIKDGEHGIAAGFAGLSAGDKAIAALEPNADLLGLNSGKTKTSFLSGSADERIQFAVKTMKAIIPQVNGIAGDIDTLRKELDQIDPNRYPEEFQGKKIRSQLVGAKATIENAANIFVNAQPLITNLPAILGEPKERRYLVLFQNDKELRPTGGFLTAFAQFRLVGGKAILERSDDIYKLDDSLKKNYPAPPEILKYHVNVNTLHIRDSNLSPDFKTSMMQFESMYKNVGGTEKIDGIIAMDTHAMVEALKILGPIYAGGREFSAVNDPRCNCPKAVYELEDYSSRPVNYVRTERKDIIGTLMQTMLHMALGTSPSKYWGQLFQMAIDQINQKHILAYFTDADSQKAVESFNMAGRIMTKDETAPILKYKEGEWDYFHMNQANMAGQKSNMFVTDKVTREVTTNADGTISSKVTVDYKNPFPGSDCNLERGGLCLNAPLRNWVRVYVPKGSKLVDSKGTQSPKTGQAEAMTSYDSLEKTVFEGFLIVNPQGIAQLQFSYTSPVKVTGDTYKVLIQKQAGTQDEDWTLKVNNKKQKKFLLNTDTEITL